MLKLLRTLKIDKSTNTKVDPGTNAIVAPAPASADSSQRMSDWPQFSSRLMDRLSSATQTPMPQMPVTAPALEIPRKEPR